MNKAPSGVVILLSWLNCPVKKLYNTRDGGQYRPKDVALRLFSACACMTASIICSGWRVAWATRFVEHQPSLKRLTREPDDAKMFGASLRIVSSMYQLLGNEPSHPLSVQ
jgi:hypothetical protein